MLRAGALGRPRGMGWGGRQEGGSGRVKHVNPWLIHVNVWQKPLQYCKVISLQLINGEKKKEYWSGMPFSSAGDCSDPRIEPMSPLLEGRFYTTELSGKRASLKNYL